MKDWPIYYKDFLTIANVESNVAFCSLWTPKDSLLEKIDKDLYSVAGQLYSKRGINYIIRNVLANPIIDTIILCGADRSESGEAFLKFMKNGITDDYKVEGDKKCEIHKEVDKKAIEDFRTNVKLINMIGDKVTSGRVKQFTKKKKKQWANPRKFKQNKFKQASKFPSEKTTFQIRSKYIWQSWVQILRKIMKFGSNKGMIKIGEVKELVNVISVITDEDPYDPELKNIFNFKKKDLEIYYEDFFNSDKGDESYNYGQRLKAYPVGLPVGKFNSDKNSFQFSAVSTQPKIVHGLDQLEEIYEKYKRYHQDRGLVAALWNPWIDNVKEGWMADGDTKRAGNVPCMIFLQFTYRSKKLHLTAYFRSNDMFDAWPRNAFALRKLQYDFADRISKKPGYLTTISNCAQIYETNYKRANQIIKKYSDYTFCEPDPRSSIIIEVEHDEIVVRHMSPDGTKQLDEIRYDGTKHKAALKIMDKLMIKEFFSNKFQVADIAIELTKAEWCVKNAKRFVQDKDWREIQ